MDVGLMVQWLGTWGFCASRPGPQGLSSRFVTLVMLVMPVRSASVPSAVIPCHGRAAKVDKVPLKTVRPFEFADLVLHDLAEIDPDSGTADIERELKKQVRSGRTDQRIAHTQWLSCAHPPLLACMHAGGGDDHNRLQAPQAALS